MSMHTNGPWVIVTNRYGQPDNIIGENVPLSGVVCSFGVKVKRTCALPELKANARLIAAAPELLEALTDCVEHMHWTQPQGEAAWKKAKAVIAKATGEHK